MRSLSLVLSAAFVLCLPSVLAARHVQLSDLVLEEERSEDALKQRTEAVGADILVWRMPSFADPKPVEDAIKKARAYKTLVIDLRRNGGGAVSTLSTMVSGPFGSRLPT